MLPVWAVSAAPVETMYAILPRSGAIAEVDVGQRQVSRILPVAPVADPRFGVVSPDGASLYLASWEGVSVIDTSSNKVSRLIPLLREPAGSWFLGPIALSPDGAFLYVTTLGTHQSDHKDTLTVIDTATFETVSVIPLGFRPSDMAVTRDGAVYVALDASYAVWRINPAAREVVATIRVRRAPLHLAANPDGASLYVLTPASLEVISTASDSITASVVMDGGAPQDVAVTPDGREVLVTATGGRMKVVDAATMEVAAEIDVSNDGIGQVLVTANGRFAYVVSSDIIEDTQVLNAKVVDLVERQVTAALPLRRYPWLLAMNRPLNRAYVTETPPSETISIIDTVTHAVVGEVSQRTLYAKPAISPAGEVAYFATYDALGNSILVLETASKSFSDAIPVADAFQNFHADRTGMHLYAVGKMIAVIDASTRSVVARGDLPERAHTSTLTEDGTTLYTVGARSIPDLPYCLQQSLYATDTTALTTTEFPLPGGGHALDITVSPDGQRVYVSRAPRNIPGICYAHPTSEFCDCPPFRAIAMVDVKQQTTTELVGVSSGILAMHPGGRSLYVGTESQAIQVVDTDSNHLVDSIPVLFHVDYLEFDSNGLHLYAGSSYAPFITIIDTLTNEIVDTIFVGAGVSEVAIAPQSHAGCLGDCDRDDIVDVAEVLLGINVVLGITPLSVCDSLSPDGQTQPTVDRIVLAVDNALNGCRPVTPTPSPSPTCPPL
jgi:serine/threonine-protein kinase